MESINQVLNLEQTSKYSSNKSHTIKAHSKQFKNENKSQKNLNFISMTPIQNIALKKRQSSKQLNPLSRKITQLKINVSKWKKSLEHDDLNIKENLPFKKLSFHRNPLITIRELKNIHPEKLNDKSKSSNKIIDCFTPLKTAITINNEDLQDNSFGLLNDLRNKKMSNKRLSLIDNLIQNKSPRKEALIDVCATFIQENRILDKLKNVIDSFSDEEGILHLSREHYSFIIKFNGNFKIIWNCIIIILIFYASLVFPFIITFYLESGRLFQKLEILFEIIFLLDIFVNFNCEYVDEEENVISVKKVIFFNYLLGWFFFDLICSIPVTLLNNVIQENLISNNFFVISQWLKPLRLIKISNYDAINNLKFIEDSKFNRVIKSSLYFLILSHISCCLWVFTGINSEQNTINWIFNIGLQNSSISDIYISSYYYILVTVFTIGYSDLVPINLTERMFTNILLIFGTMIFSFGISSISTLFGKEETKLVELNEKLKKLEQISEDYNISDELYSIIKNNLYHEFNRNHNEKYVFLESLPTKIRNELSVFMYRHIIRELKFFKNQNHDFVFYVMPYLKSHFARRGEVLFSVGEYIEEVYLVVKGCLGLTLGNLYDNLEIAIIDQNSHFGDLLMTINKQSLYELKCKSQYADVLFLNKSYFLKIKTNFYDQILRILSESFKSLEIIDKRRQLFIHFYKHYQTVSEVTRIMKRLNKFLMEKDFLPYFYYDQEFEDANEFINNHDIFQIQKLIKKVESQNSSNDTNNLTAVKHSQIKKKRIRNRSLKNYTINLLPIFENKRGKGMPSNSIKRDSKNEDEADVLQLDNRLKGKLATEIKKLCREMSEKNGESSPGSNEIIQSNSGKISLFKKSKIDNYKPLEKKKSSIIPKRTGERKCKTILLHEKVFTDNNINLLKQETELTEKTLNLLNFEIKKNKRSPFKEHTTLSANNEIRLYGEAGLIKGKKNYFSYSTHDFKNNGYRFNSNQIVFNLKKNEVIIQEACKLEIIQNKFCCCSKNLTNQNINCIEKASNFFIYNSNNLKSNQAFDLETDLNSRIHHKKFKTYKIPKILANEKFTNFKEYNLSYHRKKDGSRISYCNDQLKYFKNVKDKEIKENEIKKLDFIFERLKSKFEVN